MSAATVPVLAVDGPSGSGKGAVSARVARTLDWHYLDSGAIYRALGLFAERQALEPTDEAAITRAAGALDVRFDAERVVLAGEDVSDAIRSEACGEWASKVAAIPGVRAVLLQKQHSFRRAPGLVADGRDMGTSVFPDARLKIFLTASPEVRAERRYKQLKEKGFDVNLPRLLGEIRERDRRDAARLASPLRPADDAVILDTSSLGIDEVVHLILARLRERLK